MANKMVTCSTVAALLFAQTKHKKGKLLGVNIDNQSLGPRTIRLQDVFTTDASAGASATAYTKERLQLTIPAGQSASLDEKSLKGIEMLGAAYAIGDAVQPLCIININYSLD